MTMLPDGNCTGSVSEGHQQGWCQENGDGHAELWNQEAGASEVGWGTLKECGFEGHEDKIESVASFWLL